MARHGACIQDDRDLGTMGPRSHN